MWQIIDTYLGIVIMTLGVYIFGIIILQEREKCLFKNSLLYILVISLIHYMISANIMGTPKTLIICFINMLFYKYTFKITLKRSIFITFLYMIILILTELVELVFLTKILGLSKELCYNGYAGSLISNLCVCILFIGITIIIKKIYIKLIDEKIENNKKIVIYCIVIFVCIGMLFFTIVKEFRTSDNILLYLTSIIVLVVVLFSLIKQTLENKKITNEYDRLLEFMMTYENEVENQRILRHEIKNEFRTIRAKLSDRQNNKEIIEYIDEILNDKYEISKEKYAKFGYLPPNGIKGLFYFKTQEAENKGIKVSINISKKLKNSTIYSLNVKQQRDFGRIIGVFLDNAIEASGETKEKQIGVEVYVNDKGEVKLIISNTYNNQIDKTKLGIESFSTKGNARGHGLLLVKQLVNKNNVFDIKTEIQNNIYIQTLEIKKIIED